MVKDIWVDNNGVRLHCLIYEAEASSLLPLVFVHGRMGSAENYRSEMEYFGARSSLAMSLRGRGQSDVPKQGYTFADHVADLTAVIAASGWDRFYLWGYSVGVTFAVGYTLQNLEKVAGLILGDWKPVYRKITSQWVDGMLHYQPDYNEEMLRAMQADSAEVDMWEQLGNIQCPVLVMKGGAEGSGLSEDDLVRYRELLPNVETVIFPEAGHELWEPNPELFLQVFGDFLRKLD